MEVDGGDGKVNKSRIFGFYFPVLLKSILYPVIAINCN
jgi:hypothetical protein